jgi:hypothetical protein
MRKRLLALLTLIGAVLIATAVMAADTQQVVAVCGTPTGLTYPVPGLGNVTLNTSGLLCVTGNTAPVGYGSATAITGNATGSTGAVVGTLAGTAGKTTYICGFNVSAIGGTATVGPVTVAGLVGSSQVYQLPVNAVAGQILVTQNFSPCIPASAANTAITVTTTADGTATAVDVNSWGYQL